MKTGNAIRFDRKFRGVGAGRPPKIFFDVIVWLALVFGVFSTASASAAAPGEESILISDFSRLSAGQNAREALRDWSLKVWQGRADMEIVSQAGRGALRLRSHRASASIYRDIKLDPKRHPVITWRWKVTKLPRNADARDRSRDDQAAGVYIAFPRFPSFINSRLIGYVWDSKAPEGTVLRSRKNPMVHYIVVRSGERHLGRWITEKRNISEDYRRVFGEEPPRVSGISLMIDTDDTKSDAQSFFARVAFGRPEGAVPESAGDKLAALPVRPSILSN